MKTPTKKCEGCVHLAHLKFFCAVTEILNEYDSFVAEQEKMMKYGKGTFYSEVYELELKDFSEKMSKSLLESFKIMQKEVLEKVRQLENDIKTNDESLSFEYSDFTDSPKTPTLVACQLYSNTPEVCKRNLSEGKLKSCFETEKKSRIKKFTSQNNLARCLFKN
jgi:hypothetical protein